MDMFLNTALWVVPNFRRTALLIYYLICMFKLKSSGELKPMKTRIHEITQLCFSSDWFFAFNRISCIRYESIAHRLYWSCAFWKSIIPNLEWKIQSRSGICDVLDIMWTNVLSCTVNVFLLCSIRRATRTKNGSIRLRMPYGSIWLSFYFYFWWLVNKGGFNYKYG